MISEKKLSRGTLTINYESDKYLIDDLFDIAERNNPKRAFLFVSKILGKHIPVSPKKMRESYQALSAQLPKNIAGDALFIGMAETAVGLSAGVFHEAKNQFDRAIFLTSTRHEIDGELLCEFKENHSHATDHLIYLPQNEEMRDILAKAKTLVLIDDEVTTGNTFRNLIRALMGSGHLPQIEKVLTFTLTDWNEAGISDSVIPVKSYALIHGDWQWIADPKAALPIMPAVNTTKQGNVPIIGKQDWGRLGTQYSSDDLGRNIEAIPAQKTLVIGSGEFVWKPFLLAERLEQAGEEVYFGSTTRSPIAQGLAIKSVLSFSDNYGQGIPNYIYNVAHQTFDRVLLCVETPKENIDPKFLAALAKVANNVEVVTYES